MNSKNWNEKKEITWDRGLLNWTFKTFYAYIVFPFYSLTKYMDLFMKISFKGLNNLKNGDQR